MVCEDYKCEECGYIIESVEAESGDKLPKRKDCPECGTKKSCHRIWSTNFHLPTDFKAVDSERGINVMRNRMKRYKSPSGRKHVY